MDRAQQVFSGGDERLAAAAIQLDIERLPQPDLVTCGPTSLLSMYRYYGLDLSLEEVLEKTPRNPDGGTLAAYLALAALDVGFVPTLYPYNLRIFDPTWRGFGSDDLIAKLRKRLQVVYSKKLKRAIDAYIEVLERGGAVQLEELGRALLVEQLSEGRPILTALSATYLYQTPRERGQDFDDVRGEPTGHFVVISGYDPVEDHFLVCDPMTEIPFSPTGRYSVGTERLLASILLGVSTYDAVLMVLDGASAAGEGEAADDEV